MESYLASIYQYLYLFIVAILTFIQIGRYKKISNNKITRANRFWELVLVSFIVFAIGMRPISDYFVDMTAYNYVLKSLQGEQFYFTTDTDNLIFDNFLQWWGCNGYNTQFFFLAIATLYFGCAYIGIRRLFSEHSLIAFLVFLGAFSTFSYATNGIKAGVAASIFIMALGYVDIKWICIPLMIVSIGFHHSMVLPVVAFIITIVFKNPKWYYYGWFICFILACFHVTFFQTLFGNIVDEQGAIYLLATPETTTAHIRFRPDFVLYSAVPVLMGFRVELVKQKVVTPIYKTLMHLYLTSNAVWMLCMYASFTNRIAFLSWFIYPILIIYPFLDKHNQDLKRNSKLVKAVLYHLSFTFFMVFIYYGLLTLGH